MPIPATVFHRTIQFEGNISHMYLDTRGHVTVGVGYMLPDANAAAALSFVFRSNGLPADDATKRQAWTGVNGAPKGQLASAYRDLSKIDLPASSIQQLLTNSLESAEADLRRTFAEYDRFPLEAQEALIDMVFNLGLPRFGKYSRLISAAREGNWDVAAAQSHREGPDDRRNAAIRDLFLQAYARLLTGTWRGTATAQKSVSITITIGHSQSGYTGHMAVPDFDGGLETVVLRNIELLPGRAFRFVGVEDVAFAGRLMDDRSMSGTLRTDTGETGTFDAVKQ